MDKFFYSKKGNMVYGPYSSFMDAKEMAGVHRSVWYEHRRPAAGTYVYEYRSPGGLAVMVGEREAMLECGFITRRRARIPALERSVETHNLNLALQSAQADLQQTRALLKGQLELNAKLQDKNDELVRRLHAIKETVELFS